LTLDNTHPHLDNMNQDSAKTALVFGASGIIGWGVTNNLLDFPTPTTFEHIIALTNRPLTKAQALWPNNSRLEVHSGIDLSTSVDIVTSQLRQISHIAQVTHIYFASYVGHNLPYLERKAANVAILANAIQAITSLTSKLDSVVFFGGGKAYGLEFAAELPPTVRPKTPFREDTPRLPKPWGDNVFYYAQYDKLVQLHNQMKGAWRFAEIRPDAVVGFVPAGNPMNIAQNLGLWLSLVKEIDGEDAEVVFPGSRKAYTAKHSDTSQDLVGRFTIHASLQGNATDGQIFNIADGVTTWEEDWPKICALFSLRGVGPKAATMTSKDWVMAHQDRWAGWVEKYGLKEGVLEANDWDFIDFVMTVETDRHMDLQRARDVGFADEIQSSDVVKGYAVAFRRMREAKMIP
jgi:nucleoside-diphosphate-sugar epimerase